VTKITAFIPLFVVLLISPRTITQNQHPAERKKEMLLGLRTCQYHVKTSELKAARDWYARTLDIEPYFDEPFYVGFNVEGFELGLVPDDHGAGQLGSVFTYWGVSSIEKSVERLVQSGAKRDGDIEDVGAGIRKASVLDPFGNRFSLIENPHFGK
jgi:predicted enzyme related to lactoylglutathione lyase